MAFFRAKTSFFSIKSKDRKAKITQKNKEGFRAKWGGPLGHLTWPLNPPNKNKSKKQRNENKNTNKNKD